MGKLSKSKPSKPAPGQVGSGQTSMLNFFSKVPAGQSKLFNQLPPKKAKPIKVNKLSRTTNKNTQANKVVSSKQATITDTTKPRDKTANVCAATKPCTTPSRSGTKKDEDVIIIPETPESASATTPSSSQKPRTKINIPETPTSTKSSSSRYSKTSESSPTNLESSCQSISTNLARKYTVNSVSNKCVPKNVDEQGSKYQGSPTNPKSINQSTRTNLARKYQITSESDSDVVKKSNSNHQCPKSQGSPSANQLKSSNLARKFHDTSVSDKSVAKNFNEQGSKSQGSDQSHKTNSGEEQGSKSWGSTSNQSHKTNLGEDEPDGKELQEKEDDDDDYLPIPETQFYIPGTQLSIPETQFPNETSPTDTNKSQSKFDNILSSYQKKVESKVKIPTKPANISSHLDSKRGMTSASKTRNVFGCQHKERRKGGDNTPVGSNRSGNHGNTGSSHIGNHSNSKSERKIITAKRTISKLSRTHRKSGSTMGKQNQSGSKMNNEKDVSLDQADLDLLQDCFAENAVVVAPSKTFKISKPKIKKHRVSPAHFVSKKELPGFDDMDCSVLEELLGELPDKDVETKDKHTDDNLSVIKPTKVPLKCQNKVYASLPFTKINKDKVTEIKIGSQKRSPSRGNSPYAKRIQSESSLAKPGGHVKSLFQEKQLHLDSIQTGTKKVLELQSLDDLNTVNDDVSIMDTSQPFIDVKNVNKEIKVSATESTEDKEADISSVSTMLEQTPNRLGQSPCKIPISQSATENSEDEEPNISSVSSVLEKTPNRLGQSPCKMQASQFVNPSAAAGSDALWDGLNDSFLLGAADLEALDEMEADAVCQPQPASVDSQLSHDLKLLSPFKSQRSQTQVKLPADLNRYVVTDVLHEDWQKTVHLLDLSDHTNKICILQGTWFETPLHEGTIVAIHGKFNEQGTCMITPQQHFIIVNPDVLLTGTNVTKSIKCLRRSVLGEKFKGLDKASKPMLLGTMLHEVFDQALAKKSFSVESLRRVVQQTLNKPAFLADMYSLGLSEKQLTEDAEEYMSSMNHWADRYLQDQPKSMSTMEIKFPGQMQVERCSVCVSGVKDIEETVWSPRWGLKGKVDVTAQIKIHRPQTRTPHKTYTVPLELKTGRQTNSIEHRSQVMLYSVMLADLDEQAANDLGVLLYVKTGQMLPVPAMQMDKRELLHLRNQLAYSLALPAVKLEDNTWIAPSLPEPIQDEFTCSKCNYLTGCSVLASLDKTSDNAQIPKLFTEQLAHLSPPHKEYFSHWYLLCALEHMAVEKRNTTKQIWCKDSWDREKKGDCLSGLVISTCRHHKQRDRYLITFKRKPNHKSSVPFTSLPFSVGDRVVIGLEGSRVVTCCIGFIETLLDDQVTITSERALKVQSGSSYRMDKDDGYNSMASSLVNLARLMEAEQSRLRDLVVDLQKPIFDTAPTIPDSEKHNVAKILNTLNSDQQHAIKRVLSSQQYTLIVGMPGTGKTTTIVGLVRILHACGLSVLLTSYTHSAVDNILLKLDKHGIDLLRIGSKHRVHPDLHKYTEDVMLKQIESVQQLGSVLETKPVVATTCLGSKHKLLSRRIFDVCIVDEASQIGQLVCLGPLYVANRFVLVGDHQQLPPLVQSQAAKQLGMDESLFQRLALHRPESTVQLSLQYRMNSAIMMISNALVYEGKLQCGNETIANAILKLPNWTSLQQRVSEEWLLQVLNPSNSVSFLNTDKVEKHVDDCTAKPTVNHTEAGLVMMLVKMLIQGGCSPSSIGVIAPYRLQCKLLTGLMASLPMNGKQDIEVNTVDKYQGRDKEVIIVSFTHTQRGQDMHTGLLLEDMRRLNVAVTRAKHKLILLGSVKALNKLQTMQKLLDGLGQHHLIFHMMYSVPMDSTSN